MQIPILKDIPNTNGYYKASIDGRLWSVRKQRFLKPEKHPSGYLYINLCVDGETNRYRLHRLIALVWIPNPQSKPHINHKDCKKTNNHISNLEWCTQSENAEHAYANHLWEKQKQQCRANAIKCGLPGHNKLLTLNAADEIRQKYATGKYTQKQLADEYSFKSGSSIGRIVRNEHYIHSPSAAHTPYKVEKGSGYESQAV